MSNLSRITFLRITVIPIYVKSATLSFDLLPVFTRHYQLHDKTDLQIMDMIQYNQTHCLIS